MLERWILASLVIGALVGLRLLLRRLMDRPFVDRDGGSDFDTCMTRGCKSLRACQEPEATEAAEGDADILQTKKDLARFSGSQGSGDKISASKEVGTSRSKHHAPG